MVFVVQVKTAHLRIVEVGDEENGMIQIHTGVQEADEGATNKLQQLYEGARVQPVQQR